MNLDAVWCSLFDSKSFRTATPCDATHIILWGLCHKNNYMRLGIRFVLLSCRPAYLG